MLQASEMGFIDATLPQIAAQTQTEVKFPTDK